MAAVGSCILVLLGGGVAAVTGTPYAIRTGPPAAEPPPSPTTSTTSGSTTTTAVAATSTTTPPTGPAPSPAPRQAPVTQLPAGRPPVIPPHSPGPAPGLGNPEPTARTDIRSEPFRAANGRLSIEADYFAVGPPTETAIDIQWGLRWSDAVGYASEIGFSFGDGRVLRRTIPHECQGARDLSTIAHPNGTVVERVAYRNAGQYVVRAWVVTSSCTAGDVRTEVEFLSPPVVAGVALSNGPHFGFFTHSTVPSGADDPNAWQVAIHAGDPDGYVSQLEVTWTDGVREYVNFPLAECVDPGTSWPSSERRVVVSHRFATPDRAQHGITVLATSVGCDGADARRIGGVTTFRTAIGPY